MTRAVPAGGLGGCPVPLASAYDVALLDLDGVVYAGPAAVPGAAEALAAARAAGLRLAFVTNNAARTPAEVADHLAALGVPASPEQVVTSAQAAARLVAQRVAPGSAVLVVGGEGLRSAVRERDLRPVATLDDAPAAVVQGYAPEVGWRQLAEASYAVAAGLPWVASNVDPTLPTERGLAPGNGTLVAAVTAATGQIPVVAGKPELALHAEAVARTAARRPVVVGDRLDTDVEGARRAGCDSLLVLSGVATVADLLQAPAHRRPTYVAADLSGLLVAHPEPRRVDVGWQVGEASAVVRAGRLELAVGGDRADGLRAACAAAWAAADAAADGLGLDCSAALARLAR